jgi:Tfp pilus assembly protein PilX
MKTKKTLQSNQEDQRGITLLLSILILSAMTAIVFSVAAVALNEIRTSGDLIKTEPVIQASQALAEDGLFRTVRGYSALADCSGASVTTLNGVSVSTCASYYYTSPYNFNLSQNARRDFYLYNPTDQNANPGYTSASVTITSGSTGTIYFCPLDTQDCVATPSATQGVNTAGPATWNSGGLNPAQKYQLIIINGAGSAASYSVTTSPTGLSSGTTTMINQGSKQGVTRKIQTVVPQ